jgi:micrococcal nuclease
MYVYRATVTRVVDGDTMHLSVDLGCDVSVQMTVRLAGINTPEMNTMPGRAARAVAQDWLSRNAPGYGITLRTVKDKKEKYGRYLAFIYPDKTKITLDDRGVALADQQSLNAYLLDTGNAEEYWP